MTKSYHTPRKPRLITGRRRLLLWLILVAVLFSIGLTIGVFRTQTPPEKELAATPPVAEGVRNIILYFASADGLSLVPESRDISDCADELDCLLDTIRELGSGPRDGDLAAVLPPQLVVKGVSVEGSLVTVDFSPELVSAHPGGTQSELLTVYALADTLSVNFPHLRQVAIQVDGAPLETLKGHVDLRRPVVSDFSLVDEGVVPVALPEDETRERSE